MKLTLDTMVLRDAVDPARPDHGSARALLDCHNKGACQLSRTTRLDADVPYEKGPLRAQIEALPQLSEAPIPSLFTLGVSRLDGGDVLADDEGAEQTGRLWELVFPHADPNSAKHRNRRADIGHLVAHLRSGNDAFVTRDGPVLAAKGKLSKEFGLTVLTPEEALRQLKE